MHPESCVKGSNNVFIVNRALRASSYNPHMCVVSPEWRKGPAWCWGPGSSAAPAGNLGHAMSCLSPTTHHWPSSWRLGVDLNSFLTCSSFYF